MSQPRTNSKVRRRFSPLSCPGRGRDLLSCLLNIWKRFPAFPADSEWEEASPPLCGATDALSAGGPLDTRAQATRRARSLWPSSGNSPDPGAAPSKEVPGAGCPAGLGAGRTSDGSGRDSGGLPLALCTTGEAEASCSCVRLPQSPPHPAPHSPQVLEFLPLKQHFPPGLR